MLSLIYQAIIIVVLLTFSFGPAFFATINSAIKYGYKQSSLLVFGIVLSDLLLCALVIFLVYLGAIHLLQSEGAQTFSAILGGIILIVFGSFYFKKHVTITDEAIDLENQGPHPAVIITKGFLINLFNPAVWFLWLGNVTAVSKSLDYSVIKMSVFFSLVLGAVLLVELWKVYLAGKIKRYLTDRLMTTVNYITGIALIAFGVYLIYTYHFSKY